MKNRANKLKTEPSRLIIIEGDCNNEIINTFKNSLINLNKLLTQRKDQKDKYISMRLTGDEFGDWYWKCAGEILFDKEINSLENELLQKSKILLDLTDIPLPKLYIPKGTITETHIQTARETPIEGLYRGRLSNCGHYRLKGLCPFHQEKTPSFTVFTNTNRFYCFGCAKHGDVIDFVIDTNNLSFIEAIKTLNNL